MATLTVERYEEETRGHDAVVYQPPPAERRRHDRWQPSALKPGTPFQRPTPLFTVLDEAIADEERAKLGTEAVAV